MKSKKGVFPLLLGVTIAVILIFLVGSILFDPIRKGATTILKPLLKPLGFLEEDEEEESIDIGENLKSTSTKYVIIASLISGLLVIFSISHIKKSEKMNILLFLGITIPIILATVYLAGSTVYLNLISETKGPVHWHADYEIWNCGDKVDLIKPKGLSNRIGNPVFHDHGDNRIHVEGVVTDKTNVDLHSFFEVVGGFLEEDRLRIPTNQEIVNIRNGDLCNGNLGTMQVFLYSITNPDDNKNWIYEQQKLEHFENYVLSPHTSILPGDCIIIEFDVEKEKTEHICETYRTAKQRGDLVGS